MDNANRQQLLTAAMAELRDYSFGRLVVDGSEHRRDLIVTPRRVVPEWWRRDGHSLDDDVQLFFALGAAHIDLTPYALPGEVLLLEPASLFGPIDLPLDGQGNTSTPLPIGLTASSFRNSSLKMISLGTRTL